MNNTREKIHLAQANFRLPPEELELLKKLAVEHDRKLSEFIRFAVRQYVRHYAKHGEKADGWEVEKHEVT